MAIGEEVFKGRVRDRTFVDLDADSSILKNGDILLCSGTAPFSEMIKAATDSLFSHVGIILWLDVLGEWMVLESVESIGVRAVTLRSYAEDYCGTGGGYPGHVVVGRHAQMSDELLEDGRFSTFAVRQLGHGYDRVEINRIAAHIVTAGLLDGRGKFKEARRFICSEFAARCLEEIGIAIMQECRSFIAPADFGRDEQIAFVGHLKSKRPRGED